MQSIPPHTPLQELSLSGLYASDVGALAQLRLPCLESLKLEAVLADAFSESNSDAESDIELLGTCTIKQLCRARRTWLGGLRRLTLRDCEVGVGGLAPLAGLSLAALEFLNVSECRHVASPLACAWWAADLAAPHAPRLTELVLSCNDDPVPEAAAAFACHFSGSLRSLTLSSINCTEDGSLCAELARVPFAGLQKLSLHCDVTSAGVVELAAAPWLSSLANLWLNADYQIVPDAPAWAALAAASLTALRVFGVTDPNMMPAAATVLGNAPWICNLHFFSAHDVPDRTAAALLACPAICALREARRFMCC